MQPPSPFDKPESTPDPSDNPSPFGQSASPPPNPYGQPPDSPPPPIPTYGQPAAPPPSPYGQQPGAPLPPPPPVYGQPAAPPQGSPYDNAANVGAGAPYGIPGGMPPGLPPADIGSKKAMAGICGILLGSLGVHKFILGYNQEGIIMAVASVVTCGCLAPIIGLVGLVEGIMYLTKSDQEFYNTYMVNKKTWF